jgi:signal transduction histidine kinase
MQVFPIDVEEVDRVVRHVVDEVASAHPDRVIRLDTHVPGAARFDRTRVAQMLSNLVANAVEHSPPGEPVSVAVDAADGLIRFAITSRGEPIAAEVMPRLFQPYFRGNGAGPRTGLGLGLYIASEIARAHGGAIHVASSAEAGTTFTALIPRSPAD